ncbi:Collagen Alpha-2(Vi) Chain [Manis pentadactyla]|nr:Collagen Alpha-2(Vi) Chain [Manis pentadactyla]
MLPLTSDLRKGAQCSAADREPSPKSPRGGRDRRAEAQWLIPSDGSQSLGSSVQASRPSN